MQKAQCIIQQYGNYTIDELGVSLNGINTQGENIADNGGIKEAYQAYSKYPVPSVMSSFPIWNIHIVHVLFIQNILKMTIFE